MLFLGRLDETDSLETEVSAKHAHAFQYRAALGIVQYIFTAADVAAYRSFYIQAYIL